MPELTRKRAWIMVGIVALLVTHYTGSDIPRWLLLGAIGVWFIAGDGIAIAKKALDNVVSLVEGIV